MNIHKISLNKNQSFKANVKVNAPENLLKEEDKKYFESLGPSIGNDTDTFEITISDLKPSDMDPSVLVYQCSQNYKSQVDEFRTKYSNITIPYIKNGKEMEDKSPKTYLQKIFDRLMKK